MLDIILLSYNEPLADAAWDDLKDKAPWAIRIDGIEGIMNAHKEAAKKVRTEQFYVVDADAVVNDDFDFSYKPSDKYSDFVHVWRSVNPINDLEYGYGGIKLFPRQTVLDFQEGIVDFTTTVSKKFKVMEDVASITRFNTSGFDAWKSGFRECVKLSSHAINRQDKLTTERLDIWCTVGNDKIFGDECIRGANEGKAYGSRYKDDVEQLQKINDFRWLKERYENGQ